MWHKIASLILKNRLFILSIIAILTVFFGYYAVTSLKIDNKYGNTLPQNSEAQSNYLHFKEMFGEDGGALVIAIQTDSLYTEDVFLSWKELGDSILKVDGVESVISEATLFTIKNNITENKFEVNRVFSDVKFQEKSIDSIKREIYQNPIYRNVLYNPETNVSIMIVSIDESYLQNSKKATVVLDIEKLASTYENQFGHVHFAGLPHLRVVIGKRVINEMYIFIAAAILATSILLYLFFRSFRVVMICNIVVFTAVIWSMGSIALFGFNISIMMALIPPLMIVIGIPNCIFLMNKYHQEVKNHGDKIKAIVRVITKIGTATLLTNFTTALGFSTFIFTSSEKLTEFGVIASLNILVIFLLSITILPIIVTWSKPPKERHLKHLDSKLAVNLIEKIVFITTNKRKYVYMTALILVVLGIFGLSKIEATGNITSDLPKEDQILKDIGFLEKNFGGAIPFEIMIDYKEKGRLFKSSTISKLDDIQEVFKKDTAFSKSLSVNDFIKVINMAYHGNDTNFYKSSLSRFEKAQLKKYFDKFDMTNTNGAFTIKELVDTAKTTLRVRTQLQDIGSYDVAERAEMIEGKIDSILNPDKAQIEAYYRSLNKGKKEYIDSIIDNFGAVRNSLVDVIAGKDEDLRFKLDSDFEHIKTFYAKPGFDKQLRTAIDKEYFDVTLTGTSIVVSEGTQYLVNNLISSLIFAIIMISILMAILFRSFIMVVISMIPNLIPLIITAGIMGWFNIPLKPSTLLVFSISLGISIDDTIHYLAKYRQELKTRKYTLKESITLAIRESGLGMFYTSIVLFCGFSTFTFSQFGGTQALGLLVSITLIVAMVTNLMVLPSLLFALDKRLNTKSFEEPYFEIFDEESDIELEELAVSEEKVNEIESKLS
jgi:predicted RND superfamily exporter protein